MKKPRVCRKSAQHHSAAYRRAIRGNQYGRQEEIYKCEDCSNCPYTDQCKKTPNDKTINLNRELSAMHQEVLDNLESIHGALLRMNRSIQAEGTFGVLKYDRWYKRVVRRGLNSENWRYFRFQLAIICINCITNINDFKQQPD